MKDKYKEECRQIQQNCTYTAEAHHVLANWHRGLAYVFQMVPAAVAAVTGALVAVGVQPPSWLWATVTASVITAVATVLDPNRQYEAHLAAAKNFTVLKHDARFLREAQEERMSDDAYMVAVENLHEKYNDLARTSPPTNKIAFELARRTVQKGRHEPDRDSEGRVQ